MTSHRLHCPPFIFYSKLRIRRSNLWKFVIVEQFRTMSVNESTERQTILETEHTRHSAIFIYFIRPLDIVVGGLIFYHGFFLLSFFLSSSSSFFAAWSPSSLNGTQPKSVTCSEVTAIWKRMSKICGFPSRYKFGAIKPPFGPTSQLNGNFNGLYLRNETWHRQSLKCVDNYKGYATWSQNVINFGPQRASNSTCILPTLRKFCILLHCQALQV